MAYKFQGEFAVQRTPEETYDFLTEPRKFAPLLPDFESLEVQDAENFTVKVKVGISHIRGSAQVKLRLTERSRPRRAVYFGNANVAAGGKSDLSAAFDFSPCAEGTQVKWNAEAQIFGRLASIAGGLLEPLARKNVQKVIDSVQRALNDEAQPGAAAPTQAQPGAAAPTQGRVAGEHAKKIEEPGDAGDATTAA